MGSPWDHQMRGMDFNAKQEARMIRILCKTLNQQHSEACVEKVDFDLLAVFLMQEMHWNIHIRQLVDMVLDQFGPKAHPPGELLPEPTDDHKKPFAPRTPLQSQIHHAALHVNKTINQYTQELQTNPNARQPFFLRYPTYQKFVEYSISMEKKCKLLPKDKMVVLLDEAGRCVGVAVPPDRTKEDGIFLSPPMHVVASSVWNRISRTISNNSDPSQTTLTHLKQLRTISNNSKPSQTTPNHLKQLRTISNNWNHLNPTPNHLYTNLSHLNPTPKHLYPTPIHLYPTPNHLYTTPNHFNPTPKHLNSTQKHLYTNLSHLNPTPKHLYPTPIHLYPTPIHLYTTPKHLYTTPNFLYTTPKHLNTTPNHLNSTPNHLTSHTTLTTTTMPPTRSSGRNTRSSSSLKSSTTKQNSNSKKRKAPRSSPTKKNSSRKRSGVNQEQDDDEEEEPEEEEEQEEEDEPEEEQDQPDQEEEREEEEQEEEESINLTLENFQTQLGSWSINKLHEVLGKRKKSCSNRVPPKVQDALLLLQQNYIKSKLMLSIIRNISETTTAKYL
ncbi:hypothetical protein PGT21_012407 [Puccinia graminis f. sp. tritici]|uniref:Uncharacterized protein n=1 Tax=Puccinia graminis f. sp. tritici TaxID=56615 RepID=A0A5B0QSW9_PUCGR|nr:hypothetical protein PGT21_012407 [Puccinia graminis f. sp. tritici]